MIQYLRHLAKQIWMNSGNLARIGYMTGIVLPGLLSKPAVKQPPIVWMIQMLGGNETIAGIPWGVAMVISFFSMLLWVVWGLAKSSQIQQLALQPKLEIDFPIVSGAIVVTPERAFDQFGRLMREYNSVYIRARIKAVAKHSVKHCTAFLVDVQKKRSDSKEFSETGFSDSLQLGWAVIGVKEIEMPHMVTRFVDLLKVSDVDQKLRFCGAWPLSLNNLFDEHGTYRLKIVVTGQAISESLRIDVEWNGKWDEIKAQVSPSESN
jgi:hypothetical protein